MSELERYLRLIVEPTYDDFRRNPTSLRHAYLACVATFHAVDRVQPGGNLRNTWRRQSMEFAIVDLVAHDFKHVRSTGHGLAETDRLTMEHVLYGGPASQAINGAGQIADLRNLVFVVRDAIKFIRSKGGAGAPDLIATE